MKQGNKTWNDLRYLRIVITGVHGNVFTIQQVCVYINMLGVSLMQYNIHDTIDIKHAQKWNDSQFLFSIYISFQLSSELGVL